MERDIGQKGQKMDISFFISEKTGQKGKEIVDEEKNML